ncbi:MAG: ArsR family transcriptional regulator [Candidatus Thorarchaeota archaeon]|nr:ArsR family transcriptional regulator [Candidatus Thorarchaeota archaeon]
MSEEDKEAESGRVELNRLSRELKGNTLFVYWFMLRSNESYSAREIQRRVGISSSSLSLHHLNKLIELGLVRIDDNGRYVISKKIKPGLLSLFVGSGHFFVPRFVFYSLFTTSLLFSCCFLFWSYIDTASRLLIVILSVVSAVFWIESFRLWKIQPV